MLCALILIFVSQYLVALPVIGTVASKLSLFAEMNDWAQLSVATSGRSAELIGAGSLLAENWKNLLIGMGYGWHFVWTSVYHPDHLIKNNYVHVSFVNYILQYGLIVGGMLILGMVRRPLLMIRSLQLKRLPPDLWWLPLFILGKLATAQTAYSLARDVLFWLLLGMISRFMLQANSRNKLSNMQGVSHSI